MLGRRRPRARSRTTAPDVSVAAPEVLDRYVRAAPHPRYAVELFAGDWSSMLPAELGVESGPVPLFGDPRVDWVIEQVGGGQGIDGWAVLELGPLEGGHTTMLERAGAWVLAVEANTTAYLKCLVVKELMYLTRSRFLLGDFVGFMDEARREKRRFDLVLASGVLYHAPDPLRLLESMAAMADRIAIWTHYADPAVLGANPDQARRFTAEPEVVRWRSQSVTLHRRQYLESLEWSGFCGGPEESALWMERDGLLDALRTLGFTDIRIMSDEPHHPHGPAIMLVAMTPDPKR